MSVAVRFPIPIISGIPDSSSTIVLLIPVFELPLVTLGETTVINKQAKFKTVTF